MAHKTFKDANFPVDADGRVYHLGVKSGEVCNRVLSVGDVTRAKLISELFDGKKAYSTSSKRGFHTFTGLFNGVPITVVSTNMGFPNMDFVVREVRAVVNGPMVIARFGTCGTVDTNVPLGTVGIASSSVLLLRDPDSFQHERAANEPCLRFYKVSQPVAADPELTRLIEHHMGKVARVRVGMNATADSFYSSQGRQSSHFDDRNDRLIDELCETHHDLVTLEMESFHLLDLARCSKGSLKAGAAAMVIAQRRTNDFIDGKTLEKLEVEGGRAMLAALADYPFPAEAMMSGPECVWQHL